MIFPPGFVSDPYTPEEPLPPGGFRITARTPDQPRIEAADPAAHAYAEAHLAALRAGDRLPPSPFRIEQAPRFAERGYLLDISRCRVPRMDFLFDLVDRLAALRFNQLQLYTEHTFAYRGHETVWRDSSPMTPAEIRDLDAHCRDRHVELVPNQNCFGHMERWLRHPGYRHLAECPDGFEHPVTGPKPHGTTLFPSEESARFVEGLLDELLPHFRSRKANIGGDEPWELGQGRSRDRVARTGKDEVYREFLERLFAIVESRGHEPIFWADIVLEHPENVAKLNPRAIPAIWGYEANHPFEEQCRAVSEAGFRDRFQVVPGTGTWNSFSGRSLNAAANIREAAVQGARHGARGLVLTCWGDGGHHQPTPTSFPPLVLAARHAWGTTVPEIGLAETIDEAFYANRSGHGSALLYLGEIDSLVPGPHPNRSFLHQAFFAADPDLPRILAPVSRPALAETKDRLEAVDCAGLDPRIALARDLDLWAVDRCLAAERATSGDLRLESRLEDLKDRFRDQWLAESREGGLDESLGRFPG